MLCDPNYEHNNTAFRQVFAGADIWPQTMEHYMKEIIKVGLFLCVISAIAALLLSVTYIWTEKQIAESRAKDLNMGLKTIMPQADSFILGSNESYAAISNKKAIGYCYKVREKGYSSYIDMLVGINISGEVTGVQILQMAETPGLGNNANDPAFLNQFTTKKDIQALTGATITSNAIARGVKQALAKFRETSRRLRLRHR